ncbi:MAG TPA: DNA polymerase [Meiothermus sp.]|nr:DNA polymerase [Meiothermus sp.]
MSVNYLFADMNAYFASVEQQMRPELRGKPVGVVPVMAESTCCIAASYEAKHYGVKTGTQVSDARLLCPEIEIVEARPRLYIQIHQEILKAIDTVLPVQAVLSIDEVVCKLIGAERKPHQAMQLAQAVKQAIKTRVGSYLRCSVGLGPNKLLAKVASDMKKPDGLTLLEPQDLPQALLGLRLRDFPGIGPRMEARFHSFGITTVEELYELSPEHLSRIWGSPRVGTSWWRRLRGEDLPEAPTQRRSISHSHILPPQERSDERAKAVLMRLVHKAGARLRHENYWTGSISVFVAYPGRSLWHEEYRLPLCQDTLTLIRATDRLWKRKPQGVPLKVGVILGNLEPDTHVSWPLFEEDQKLIRLAQAIDQANHKFGAYSLYFAGMDMEKPKSDPRIAFNYIPNLEIPGV